MAKNAEESRTALGGHRNTIPVQQFQQPMVIAQTISVQLETFSGRNNQAFYRWLSRFKIQQQMSLIQTAAGPDRDTWLCAILPSCFEGVAKEGYNGLSYHDQDTYENLVARMCDRFPGKSDDERISDAALPRKSFGVGGHSAKIL